MRGEGGCIIVDGFGLKLRLYIISNYQAPSVQAQGAKLCFTNLTLAETSFAYFQNISNISLEFVILYLFVS